MITYNTAETTSAKELDVDSFLTKVVIDLIKIEGTVRVLKRSLWDVEQHLNNPDKWGNEDAAGLIADCIERLRDRIEHFQIDLNKGEKV